MNTPEIRIVNQIPTLFVDGQPFFCMAGELHNSASGSLTYMQEKVWPALKGLNMNSVILPIYWEQIEAKEGTYDFTLLDGIIEQARENEMRLILLWFGLWKNAESMYVPAWMKLDSRTYFRVQKVNGEPINTISPFCQAAIDKDAACFRAIMKHIKDIDAERSTVITVQVENEIGILGENRDYCEKANVAFAAEVPELISDINKKRGTWKEVYGEDAEEMFMAYYFAKAVGQISKAGQEEYGIPMYANAWLKQYPWNAGSYPSGGPVVETQEIWHSVAPNLFTCAPDIYVSYVADVMDRYSYEGNPLFIPEVRKDAVTASYCLYAFGKHNAICYSPFGIEELALSPDEIDKPPMGVMIALNIDPSAFDIRGSHDYLAKTYQMIDELKPLMLKYRGTCHQQAFCRHGETDFGTYLRFHSYDISVGYAPRESASPLGAGIVFELSNDEFLIASTNCTFKFLPKAGENVKVEILSLDEGHLDAGEWVTERILNGDEKIMIASHNMPGYIHIKVFKY